VKVSVPPGAFEDLHNATVNVDVADVGGSGGTHANHKWFAPDLAPGLLPDCGEEDPTCEVMDDDCADGCELLLPIGKLNFQWVGVHLAVSYLDGIPEEAAGITMTIVETGS
jgi:hypothetical protein